MSKSNKLLILIIGLLGVVNIWLFFADGSGNTNSYDRSLFVINDTSQVNQIKITGSDRSIAVKKEGAQWILNDEYKVDEGLRRLFLSILQRVSIRKPVDLQPLDSIVVSIEGDVNREFIVFSNPTKTKTYFYRPSTQQSYEVEIPGYNEYLGGVFELSVNQWRDRLIMDENWRSIKSLDLDYKEGSMDDVSIRFDGDFFSVDGITVIDSAEVVDYLNQFQVLEVNEIISRDQFPDYDSLSKTTPLASLTITSIRSSNPRQLNIFPPIGNAPYQLVTDKNDELMIMESRRVNQFLSKPEDFQAKE